MLQTRVCIHILQSLFFFVPLDTLSALYLGSGEWSLTPHKAIEVNIFIQNDPHF